MATVQARAPLTLIMDCVGALVIFLFFLARIPVVCDSISVQILHIHTYGSEHTHVHHNKDRARQSVQNIL